ncbi:MAG: serine hydrolase [Syntrophobacteraceae bacterium]|nr:serine hydrolase [Syntrophobacteraceae bacterium]
MFGKLCIAFSIIIASICLLTAATAQTVKTRGQEEDQNAISAAREEVWKAITSGKGSGAAVAIMDHGKMVYSEGFGVANRSENRPIDKDTRFNIGSTSKMFAAVAVLLLVDEGKVSLDESVAKYVPEFRMKDKRYRDITVRMLFNHSSGLPGSSFYFAYNPGDGDAHKLLLDSLRDAHLKHDPGAMSIYCNDGFTLAEMLVEKVSGEKYLHFLQERIFTPLGMNHTGASIGEIGDKDVAEYYDPKSGKKYPRETVTVYGAGGLSSTAEDLCRFGESFSSQGKRILSQASLQEILRPQPTRFSDKLRHVQMMNAFGWDYCNLPLYNSKGLQVLGKGGNTLFYSANLQIVPRENISIAAVMSGQVSGEKLTRPILDGLMLDRKLMPKKAEVIKRPVEPQAIPAQVLRYGGYYVGDMGAVKITFNRGKNTVIISPMVGKNATEKMSKPPQKYVYNNGYFHDNENGSNFYFVTVEGESYFVASKCSPYDMDVPMCQKLDASRKPVELKAKMDGTVWLLRNGPASVEVPGGSERDVDLITVSSLYKELPGYVRFLNLNREEGAGFAGIAATAFRDQGELTVFTKNGTTWARSANFLFSAANGFPKIKVGSNSVRIGEDSYDEWLKVKVGAVLRFEKPERGRIMVTTPKAVLFDSVADSGAVYAPAGSYIFCSGAAGDVFRIVAE